MTVDLVSGGEALGGIFLVLLVAVAFVVMVVPCHYNDASP